MALADRAALGLGCCLWGDGGSSSDVQAVGGLVIVGLVFGSGLCEAFAHNLLVRRSIPSLLVTLVFDYDGVFLYYFGCRTGCLGSFDKRRTEKAQD